MIKKNFITTILVLTVLMVVGLACSSYGTKLDFNGGELYYTDNVTEADAKKLGEYLVKTGFFDGRKITVQLDKSGTTYQFRMVVVKEKQNDDATMILMKSFAGEISEDVFNDAPTELHICDDQLKTLREI
jgi:preprotein translocase subunit SecF